MALKSCHDRNITHRDIKPGEGIVAFVFLLFCHSPQFVFWITVITCPPPHFVAFGLSHITYNMLQTLDRVKNFSWICGSTFSFSSSLTFSEVPPFLFFNFNIIWRNCLLDLLLFFTLIMLLHFQFDLGFFNLDWPT